MLAVASIPVYGVSQPSRNGSSVDSEPLCFLFPDLGCVTCLCSLCGLHFYRTKESGTGAVIWTAYVGEMESGNDPNVAYENAYVHDHEIKNAGAWRDGRYIFCISYLK